MLTWLIVCIVGTLHAYMTYKILLKKWHVSDWIEKKKKIKNEKKEISELKR